MNRMSINEVEKKIRLEKIRDRSISEERKECSFKPETNEGKKMKGKRKRTRNKKYW